MNRKPVTPGLHGLIDYGFGVVNLAGPSLLGLTGAARALPAAWAVGQGTLNALTDQPYAVRRAIPFSVHGQAETIGLPAFFLSAMAIGVLKQRESRFFFLALFVALVTNYLLTDYKAIPKR